MYDAREKAIRDRQWQLNAAFREGEAKGEAKGKIEGQREGEINDRIERIQSLQGILRVPVSDEQQLAP